MRSGFDFLVCDHCSKKVSPGEIGHLTLSKCDILLEGEMYSICEYCIGDMEGKFMDNGGEKNYWNQWVMQKRQI